MGKVHPRSRGPSKAEMDNLTPRQQIFVAELCADPTMNLTEAARKAGYKSPAVGAQKLLARSVIRRAIGKALRDRIWRCEIEADRVLRELASVALADPAELFGSGGSLLGIQQMPEHIRRCISQFDVESRAGPDGETVTTTVRVKLHPKVQALELLMKHLGMLHAKIQDETGDSGRIDRLLDICRRLMDHSLRPRIVDSTVVESRLLE